MLDRGLSFGVSGSVQFHVRGCQAPTVPSPGGAPLDIPAWERRAELRVVGR